MHVALVMHKLVVISSPLGNFFQLHFGTLIWSLLLVKK